MRKEGAKFCERRVDIFDLSGRCRESCMHLFNRKLNDLLEGSPSESAKELVKKDAGSLDTNTVSSLFIIRFPDQEGAVPWNVFSLSKRYHWNYSFSF